MGLTHFETHRPARPVVSFGRPARRFVEWVLGRVATPPGLEVHEIGEDYILGVELNDLDVPFVRRYPLRRLR